jgi:AraC family transcriptional regulator
MSPSDYRKNPPPLTHFNQPDIALQYQLVDVGVPLCTEGMVLEINYKRLAQSRRYAVIIKDIPFPNNPGRDYLAELWHVFHENKTKIEGLKEGGNEIGVSSYHNREGYITYYVGAEIEKQNGSSDFNYWTMPKGNYLVCSFEAEDFKHLTTDALDKAVTFMLKTWLPTKQISIAAFLVELYFDTGAEGTYMELWFKTKAYMEQEQ